MRYKYLKNYDVVSREHQEDSPCKDVKNISIIIHKKKPNRYKKRKKFKLYKVPQLVAVLPLLKKNQTEAHRSSSMSKINDNKKTVKLTARTSDLSTRLKHQPYRSNFKVNMVSEHRPPDFLNPFFNPMTQTKWRIYRCQLSTQDESCCCSCNSDAMFEVMKSLYDCYKKKNCDHCNCILCGHLPGQERRLGEDRKNASQVDTAKAKKKRTKQAEKAMVGKSHAEKQKILEDLAKSGAPLPEGKTPSEKALIQKIKDTKGAPSAIKVPSEKNRKAKEAGLLTPLEGKTPQQKEKLLKGLASNGIPLPEGKTASEKKLIEKVRTEMGLPPEPKTAAAKENYKKAMASGVITPLEGKTPVQKEKILKTQAEMGVPLPEGRTPSEKSLIAKIKASVRPPSEGVTPSEKMRKVKAAGILTPLQGKTAEQKEKIIRGLAKEGLPLPVGKTKSEKKLIDKVRAELGLPPEPKTAAEKEKYDKAQAAGLIVPLEGKSPAQKEKILKGQHDLGILLPEGRTPSEKALIAKITADSRAPSLITRASERFKKAKAAGILTPLEGKTPEQKEKIIRGLAKHGLPLPVGKTKSEKKLIDKVRAELGLPPEPKTAAEKEKYDKAQAAGLIVPLEGKSPAQKEKILKGQHDLGIPLPEGRSPSEKALIAKITADSRAPSLITRASERFKKAKAAGLLTPLEGKTPEQKEKIIRGLAKHGLPLPEGKTPSERKIIDKVRQELGLPPEPKTTSDKEKYAKAQAAGLLVPLEGKSPAQKERILKGQHELGVPLPEGRTPSEKALIAKIKASPRAPSAELRPSEKIRKAKADGLLTPLEGKTPAEKEKILRAQAAKGISLPEGRTASEKALIQKIKSDAPSGKRSRGVLVGKPALPQEKAKKLDEKTAKVMKEGKGPSDECICDLLTPEKDRLSEKGRASKLIPSKITSEKLKAAKAAGLLTPLEGKTPEQKEKIIKGLAKQGLPLPEGKTASEKKLTDKVRAELGLPPEPKTPSAKEKYAQAQAAGLITPLEGKTAAQKEKILKGQTDLGLPLPEGRTPSEKALISKVKAAAGLAPSEKIRKSKDAGLLTPLEGKTPEQKEKILRGRAAAGLPLPEGKSRSEKELIKKVKATTGYVTPEGKTPSEKERYRKAKAAGLLTPLDGKTPSRKERIIKDRLAAGLPPPESKTPSEKEMINRLLATAPEAKLEGKTPSQKEKILRSIAKQGLPLPEGRTPSEKALIDNVRKEAGRPSLKKSAKAAGLSTPLEGKTPEQKEKILRNLVKAHHPLPEGKTPSEKALINKIRDEVGLPPEPKTPSTKDKYMKAQAAGMITPLEGKTPAEKEKILRKIHQAGLPLPEGRSPSEKSMVRKIKAESPFGAIPSEKIKAAKAAGLLTPMEGKTPAQKEKILRGLAKAGMPLPEAKTPSEKEMIRKIRSDLGLPPEPKSPSVKEKMRKAQAAGLITPLEGKSPAQKEKILRKLAEAGIPLPEGKTPSEKALINQIQAEVTPSKRRLSSGPPVLTSEKARKLDQKTAKVMKEGKGPSDECICSILSPVSEREPKRVSGKPPSLAGIPSEKMRQAKAAGLMTPLDGKTPEKKEKILKGLAMQGLPLPEGKTPSERKLIDKVRTELGLPPEPKTDSAKKKYQKALAAGMVQPLEGKSPAEKEKILKNLAKMGIPLPEGRTPSEKSLIAKVRAEAPPPSLSLGPSEAPIPSEKLRKAKAAGLLTPLEGKTPAEKEKIIRGLADAGLPLPEGKTKSEKKMIQKVKTALGIPPTPKTMSEKETVRKAKADGLFTPLTGKSPAKKEKILRGLAERGLPMPEGTTPSEKELLKKVRTEAGLPPELTPSEQMGKIKTKSKKVGDATSRKSAKGITASAKAAGIHEEYQDIEKSTTCDRGCGCDKKKIRFKHSYVKIRVTSPDISSLCPCPDECIPGVKHGVFTDNEGIKVTVGSAVGVPSYSVEFANTKYPDSLFFNTNYVHNKSTESILDIFAANQVNLTRKVSVKIIPSNKTIEYVYNSSLYTSCSEESIMDTIETDISDDQETNSYICDYMSRIDPNMLQDYHCESYRIPSISNMSNNSSDSRLLCRSSFDSILIVKTESSLSLSCSDQESFHTISLISIVNSSITSDTRRYLNYSRSETTSSEETTEEIEYSTNIIDYSAVDTVGSNSTNGIINNAVNSDKPKKQNVKSGNDFLIFRMSRANIGSDEENSRRQGANNKEPILVINDLGSDHNIMELVDEILSRRLIASTSSIFVVVPDSDCDTEESGFSSTICIHMSGNTPNWNNCVTIERSAPEEVTKSRGLKLFAKGKMFKGEPPAASVCDEPHHRDVASEAQVPKAEGVSRNNHCQANLKQKIDAVKCRGVIMDTTSDRPCCCSPKVSDFPRGYDSNDRCVASVVSELITPMIVRQGVAQGLSDEAYLNISGINLPSCSTCQVPRQLNATPVRHCKVPTCTGHRSCHELLDTPMTTIRWVPPVSQLADKKYSSSRNKNKEVIAKAPKETKCVGVDCSRGRYRSPTDKPRPVEPVPIIRGCGQADVSCATCSHPILVDGKKMSCLCSGVEKKIKLRPKCPCEHHQPPPSAQVTGKELRSIGCQQRCDNKERKSSCACKEKGRGRNKNVICECPYVEEESEPEPEDFEWVDERQIRKMKSDLTQTTSGFKLLKKKKPPPEEELSFEEALSYYKAFSNEDLLEPENEDVCHCEDDSRSQKATKNKDVYCECPYDEYNHTAGSEPGSLPGSLADEEPEEPLRGLKFVVGGKGSGSKGLSGICCFDIILQESNLVTKTIS